MSVIATSGILNTLKDPETQKTIAGLTIGILESAPMAALSVAAVTILQWNLEHISIKKTKIPITVKVTNSRTLTIQTGTKQVREKDGTLRDQPVYESKTITEKQDKVVGYQDKYIIYRLSTKDTSVLSDKDMTPISPPIMSLATRLADAGADTAEHALALAQKQIESTQKKGLLRTGIEFLFGGG